MIKKLTSDDMISTRSSNDFATGNPHISLILLYGGRPVSRPLWMSYDKRSKPIELLG